MENMNQKIESKSKKIIRIAIVYVSFFLVTWLCQYISAVIIKSIFFSTVDFSQDETKNNLITVVISSIVRAFYSFIMGALLNPINIYHAFAHAISLVGTVIYLRFLTRLNPGKGIIYLISLLFILVATLVVWFVAIVVANYSSTNNYEDRRNMENTIYKIYLQQEKARLSK